MERNNSKHKNWYQRSHAYLDDFRRTVSGEYIYAGDMHRFDGDKPLKKSVLKYILLSAVSFVLIVACGCFRVAGMNACAYVLLPYTAGLILNAIALWAVCRLSFSSNPVRDYVYKATVPRFSRCSMFSLICFVVTLIGDIVFVAINGFGRFLVNNIIFYVFVVCCFLLSLIAYLGFKKLPWTLLEKEIY